MAGHEATLVTIPAVSQEIDREIIEALQMTGQGRKGAPSRVSFTIKTANSQRYLHIIKVLLSSGGF